MYILLAFALLIGGLALAVIITGLCERQRLTGDVEPAQPPYPWAASRYWEATRADAIRLGLQHGGDFATKKNASAVKGLASMFLSPDQQVIVSISSASLVGAKVKKTVLRSKFANGRVLESSDNSGAWDLSGVIDRSVLLNAGIEELMGMHLQRVRSSGTSPMPFSPTAVLDEFENIDLDRGRRLVLLKLARWADPQQTSIRLTLRGSLMLVRKMISEMGKLRAQQHRAAIKRAGSRPQDRA